LCSGKKNKEKKKTFQDNTVEEEKEQRRRNSFLKFYCGFFQEPLPVKDNRKYNRTVLHRTAISNIYTAFFLRISFCV